MKRRVAMIVAVVVVFLLVVGYFGAGYIVYNRLSNVSNICPEITENSPQAFSVDDVDTRPYLIEDYQTVSFPSRDSNITISGWYAPAAENEADAPTVIVVHGLGNCKASPGVLVAGGMLHRNGFNVLMMDLRDHGQSTIEDGRYAGGTEEYRDVLGAWDWLVNEQGYAPEKIGLMGESLGAATVMIAAGEEPRVAAVWEDSGFADLRVALDAELTRNGYPTFLASGGILIARLVAGDDITAFSPLAEMDKLNGRPIFITHGTDDKRLSVQYAYDLAEAVQKAGGQVKPWIVDGAGHVEAIFTHAAEYEEKLVDFFRTSLTQPGFSD